MDSVKKILTSCDMFRRVQDTERYLTPGSKGGATGSIVCALIMTYLFLQETRLYLKDDTTSAMGLSNDQIGVPLRATINITFPYLPCFAVSLDVLDIMGHHAVGVRQDLRMTRTEVQTGELKDLYDDASYNDDSASRMAREGCNVAGYFYIHKVPGNFHISCHGTYDRVIRHLGGIISVRHIMHSLYFGDIPPKDIATKTRRADLQTDSASNTDFSENSPLESYQYYTQIVPTAYDTTMAYQYTNHVHHFNPGGQMPAVYFGYQMSSIMVQYNTSHMSLPRYLCNMCAVVGGLFTIFKMMASVIGVSKYVLKQRRENK